MGYFDKKLQYSGWKRDPDSHVNPGKSKRIAQRGETSDPDIRHTRVLRYTGGEGKQFVKRSLYCKKFLRSRDGIGPPPG